MGNRQQNQRSSAARVIRVRHPAGRSRPTPPPRSPALTIEILVREQRLRLRQGDTVPLCCAISTSKSGLGSEPGSNRTPTGRFRIAEKHGHHAPYGTIFVSRQPVGRWRPGARVIPDDLITSRILWLEGLDPSNANTYDRYIYLHGTNQEHLLGTPHSHGCVRLANDAVIALFDLAPVGTAVVIR
jgi:L,D-transpeptidase YbiS